MEFFYCCTTCVFRRREAGVKVVYDDTKMWCTLHNVLLPIGPGSKDAICSQFSPADPRATELQEGVKRFPQGELWIFEIYRPSRKLATIADLPKVDPQTGKLIPS